MRLLEARPVEAEEGRCMIEVPFRDELTHQELLPRRGDRRGRRHRRWLRGPDRCPSDREMLTFESKVNLLAPARRERLVARGEVLRPRRRLFACKAEVEAVDGDERRTCATLLQTVSLSPVEAGKEGT